MVYFFWVSIETVEECGDYRSQTGIKGDGASLAFNNTHQVTCTIMK